MPLISVNDLGLTGSIVLRSGRLSEIIAQLQELLKGVDEVRFRHLSTIAHFLLLRYCQLFVSLRVFERKSVRKLLVFSQYFKGCECYLDDLVLRYLRWPGN